ncbi:tyrosine-type recombinase/integrase [Pedobacter sp. SYP-B3415]|uniref:tyrosine-type recombinase/integrase n=1 Tax=Pedobacter sp. SYP-B3415 TaxID=2496641 RepID=UPI00101C584E|nr:tyrosine-type recombinase/integrase [Pedobacter sp. SYP-B3415]
MSLRKSYRRAKIYRGRTGSPTEKWHVWYSYRNPITLKFERFKVYEELNYIKDHKEKEEYAKDLVTDTNVMLRMGYTPFAVDKRTETLIDDEKIAIVEAEKNKADDPQLIEAFEIFLKAKRLLNLDSDTITTYCSYISKFENYLFTTRRADIHVRDLTAGFLKDMLTWLSDHHKWNPTTYNNHLRFCGTLANWFSRKPRQWVKKDDFVISKDEELEFKTAKPMKHQYFGATVADRVKKEMIKIPQLEFYCKFIYYSCMRPDEIRELVIENVDIKGRYIKIVGKTKSRTIPICDELAALLETLNLDQHPLSSFVIGKDGQTARIRHSEGYFARLFREYIRKPLELSENFTPYGWKHTRVVDLLNAGYSDAEVKNLTGHTDTESYDKYKRDLVNYMHTRLRGQTLGF